MAENARPPVAIRIVRPYENEDEFLEAELETVGKTSVILIGAHPRPTGVILRFEVTLTNGATVLRGEGRVLGHKENAFRGQPGLSLRFTRLDPRSKALVDRATGMREIRAANGPRSQPAPSQRPSAPISSRPAMPSSRPSSPTPSRPPTSRPDPALAAALTQETPSPTIASRPPSSGPFAATAPPSDQNIATAPPSDSSTAPPEPFIALAPPPVSRPPEAPTPFYGITTSPMDEQPTHVETRTDYAPAPVLSAIPRSTPRQSGPLTAPPNRDDLLSRLRDRASSLPKDRIDAILAARR